LTCINNPFHALFHASRMHVCRFVRRPLFAISSAAASSPHPNAVKMLRVENPIGYMLVKRLFVT